MRVSQIAVIPSADYCQLQARVASDFAADDAQWFEPFTLWYRFPPWCAPYLSPENGDPFLAALLGGAMEAGERLAIAAPISPRLRDAVPDIQHIYAAFYPHVSRIPVEVESRDWPLAGGVADAGVGLFFSLGVDSFYSLLKNQRDHPADGQTITHLVPVHGFDMYEEEWDSAFPPALLSNFQRVADEMGKTLVPVVTNVRRVTSGLTAWPNAHGGGTLSIALALGAMLREVHLAASATYDKLYPWGSHPVLDPLWSTESLTVVHDGCEMNTIDKTAIVARSTLAMETLRPCAGPGTDYNCGRCEKCLRTMLDLTLAGAIARAQTLPHEIDPDALRESLRPGGPVHMADFGRRLDELRAAGKAPAVCQALEEHLAEGMAGKWLPQTSATTKHRASDGNLLRRVLGRIGG
jgi:hypothetical protein